MNISSNSSVEILKNTGINLNSGVNISGSGVLVNPCLVYSLTNFTNLSLGGYSYLSPLCEVFNLTIGNYCSIARGFIVGLSHPMDLLTANPIAWRPFIPERNFPGHTNHDYKHSFIGNDVWIGANVILKEGLTIGDGCIIGAGSVITKDIPPYSIAVGNPCRVIRPRFDDKFLSRVIKSEWFNYDWSEFHINWDNADKTLDFIQNTIDLNNHRGFDSFKYEVTSDGIQFFKMK